MKRWWPIPIWGMAVAFGLYGSLRLAEPAATLEDDPWSAAFREAGFEARFRSITDERKTFMVIERREAVRAAEYGGTTLRTYVIEGFSVQITSFPEGASLRNIVPEGAKKNWKPTEARNPYHVCRAGRHVLVLRTTQGWRVMPRKIPEKLVDGLFRVFKSAAGENENPKD